MAVSEAIYGSTTSYVSSSAYYGFVPQNSMQTGNNYGGSWVDVDVNTKETRRNGNCHGAMETDDDSRDAALVNNYCVIPEALRGINTVVYSPLDVGHDSGLLGFGALDRQPRQENAARRRNRKRNNDGELLFVESDQFKKLRKGSGNRCTDYAGGFAKDCRLAEMHYKSSRLCVSEEWTDCEEEKLTSIESCCWAAGNHSFIIKHDNDGKHKVLLNGCSKLGQIDNSEYERMLLETHGCSAYHYQGLQLQNGIAEAEF